MQFKKIGENTFQWSWQSLKFVCSKFRTKLNLPPVQVLFYAGKTPLGCSKKEERLCKTQKKKNFLDIKQLLDNYIISSSSAFELNACEPHFYSSTCA